MGKFLPNATLYLNAQVPPKRQFTSQCHAMLTQSKLYDHQPNLPPDAQYLAAPSCEIHMTSHTSRMSFCAPSLDTVRRLRHKYTSIQA